MKTRAAAVAFDCTGNTDVMRQAPAACHRGWRRSMVTGVAEATRRSARVPSSSSPGGSIHPVVIY